MIAGGRGALNQLRLIELIKPHRVGKGNPTNHVIITHSWKIKENYHRQEIYYYLRKLNKCYTVSVLIYLSTQKKPFYSCLKTT